MCDNIQIKIFSFSQMHATTDQRDGWNHIFIRAAVHIGHMLFIADDREGTCIPRINWKLIAHCTGSCDPIPFHFQTMNGMSLSDLLMPICMVLFGLLLLQILFFFGEKLHFDLIHLNDMVYQSKWHRYPYKVRIFVLLVMMRAQRPFYLSAYGIIELNMVNFLQVSVIRICAVTSERKLHNLISGAQMDLFSFNGVPYNGMKSLGVHSVKQKSPLVDLMVSHRARGQFIFNVIIILLKLDVSQMSSCTHAELLAVNT